MHDLIWRAAAPQATGKAYALTAAGHAAATRLHLAGPAAPDGPLHSPPTGHSGLLLLVDVREGGGERHHLPEIVELLQQQGVPTETRSLPTGLGDYLFVFRTPAGRDYAVPLLIERKRVDPSDRGDRVSAGAASVHNKMLRNLMGMDISFPGGIMRDLRNE